MTSRGTRGSAARVVRLTKILCLTGSRCLCRGCGQLFNSVTAFDSHRVDDRTGPAHSARRCLTPAEMQRVGMSINSAEFWITEVRKKDRIETGASRFSDVVRWTPKTPHKGVRDER
jgi:hypothetical protein